MNTHRSPGLSRLFLIVSCGLFLMPTQSQARPPRARERTCVIQSIEHSARTMSLQCGNDSNPLELVWKKDTRFLKDWKFTEAAGLKAGQTVVVYYKSPFFGKKFATKVILQNG